MFHFNIGFKNTKFSEKINKHVPLREIAKRQSMSEKYLESLFAILKSTGIIGSRRGAKGGYYLIKSPGEITALEVINAIEGPVSVVDCCISEQFCDRIDSCKTIRLWKKVNRQVLNELKKTFIQDLMY